MVWSAFGVVPLSRDEVLYWGGCFGFPFAVDVEGYREVIKSHSFKLKEPLQYYESLFPLLAGVRLQDFPEPRLEAPQAKQALPPPDDNMDMSKCWFLLVEMAAPIRII